MLFPVTNKLLAVSALGVLCGTLLTGCEPAAERAYSNPVASTNIERSESSAQQQANLPTAPESGVAFTFSGDPEDVSIGTARRVSGRIVIPLGHSREEVETALQEAVIQLAKREEAQAAMVFAYRPGEATTGTFTVGKAVLAPNGRWEDASETGPMETQVEIGNLYFADTAAQDVFKRGDKVRLRNDRGAVSVSARDDAWGEEHRVAKVPNGTRAVIQERVIHPISPEYEIIRCRITFKYDGQELEGWIHERDIADAK